MCIPTRTHLTYNNNKKHGSLQTSDSSVRPKKMLAERGLKSCINRPNTHWKRRSEWQRGIILVSKGTNYLPVILLQCGKAWKTSTFTRHHPPALWRINIWQTIWMSSIAGLKKHHSLLLQPPLPTPALQIRDDVRQIFNKNKRRKASGPDGVLPACLNTCAEQLSPIFTQIFNRSPELCEIPSCFKCSTIIPAQRNPKLLDLMTTDLWL